MVILYMAIISKERLYTEGCPKSSGVASALSYSWSLNSSTYSTGTNVWTRIFTTPGTKLVTATVLDSTNQGASQDIFITIN